MFGTKRKNLRTENNIGDIISEYKKYDVFPLLSVFSDNLMKFYMEGRMGIWKIAPKFQVLVKVETHDIAESKNLCLCVKPSLMFYFMNGLAVLLFMYIAWSCFNYKSSPFFLFVPVLIIFLSLIENGWQQDICIKKLERIASKTEGRQGDG